MNLQEMYKTYNGNISAMARELGVSRQTVHERCKKLGLNGTGNKLTRVEQTLVKSTNLTRVEIAEVLSICLQTVDRYLDGKKLIHGNIKYNDSIIIDTLKKYNGNILKSSRELGMHYSVLHRMLKNRKINAKDYK